MRRELFFLYFGILIGIIDATNTICNPQDPSRCSFGGECKSQNPSVNSLVPNNAQICSCPSLDCTTLGYDPVCGSDGRNHFNIWCKRLSECSQQKTIHALCNGFCGTPECKANPRNARRCSPEDDNHCINLGECLLTNSGIPYCNCPKTHTGERCETLVQQTGRDNKCSSVLEQVNYKLAFLCTLGLLGLVFLFLVIFCGVKCCRHRNEEKHSIEFNTVNRSRDTEKGNTTPNTMPKQGCLEMGAASLR